MAEISGKAFLRTATPEKALHGFQTCGLWPFDENVFSDEDFVGSLVTDEQPPASRESSTACEKGMLDIDASGNSDSARPVPDNSQLTNNGLNNRLLRTHAKNKAWIHPTTLIRCLLFLIASRLKNIYSRKVLPPMTRVAENGYTRLAMGAVFSAVLL